jgi:hypothetical protein
MDISKAVLEFLGFTLQTKQKVLISNSYLSFCLPVCDLIIMLQPFEAFL